MTYDPKRSHGKGIVAAVPAGASVVLIWAVREFFHREVPAEVAVAVLGGLAYLIAWGRNKAKNAWKL